MSSCCCCPPPRKGGRWGAPAPALGRPSGRVVGGVSGWEPGEDLDACLARADRSLYNVKQSLLPPLRQACEGLVPLTRVACVPVDCCHRRPGLSAFASIVSKLDKSVFGFEPSGQHTDEEHPSLIPSLIGPPPPRRADPVRGLSGSGREMLTCGAGGMRGPRRTCPRRATAGARRACPASSQAAPGGRGRSPGRSPRRAGGGSCTSARCPRTRRSCACPCPGPAPPRRG